MFDELNEAVDNIFNLGVNEVSLSNLYKIKLVNEGIYEEVNDKIKLICKNKKVEDVLSLKILLNALDLVQSRFIENENNEQLQDIVKNNKINKYKFTLYDSLKKQIAVDYKKFTQILANNIGYFGNEVYIGNHKFYDEILEKYSKIKTRSYQVLEDLELYGEDLAKYTLDNYDFKGKKKRGGDILIFCSKYYPVETAKVATQLINEPYMKEEVFTCLGYDRENEQILYEKFEEFKRIKEKKGKRVAEDAYRGLIMGLYICESKYLKEAYTIFYKTEYVEQKSLDEQFIESYNKVYDLCELSFKGNLKFLKFVDGEFTHNHAGRIIKYIDIIETIDKKQKLEYIMMMLDKVFIERWYVAPQVSRLYYGVLRYIFDNARDENNFEKWYRAYISNYDIMKSETDLLKILYYFNQEEFEKGSIHLKILEGIMQLCFENYYKENTPTTVQIREIYQNINMSTLRTNIYKTDYYSNLNFIKEQANSNIIDFENKKLKKDINVGLNKLNLEDEVVEEELRLVTKLICKNFKKEDAWIIEKLVNIQYLKIDTSDIDSLNFISKLDKLKYVEIVKANICKIEEVDNLINLEYLNLDDNKIPKIEGVDKLVNLKELQLRRNKIEEIEGIDSLRKLETLSASSDTGKHTYLSGERLKAYQKKEVVKPIDKIKNLFKKYVGK